MLSDSRSVFSIALQFRQWISRSGMSSPHSGQGPPGQGGMRELQTWVENEDFRVLFSRLKYSSSACPWRTTPNAPPGGVFRRSRPGTSQNNRIHPVDHCNRHEDERFESRGLSAAQVRTDYRHTIEPETLSSRTLRIPAGGTTQHRLQARPNPTTSWALGFGFGFRLRFLDWARYRLIRWIQARPIIPSAEFN